MPEFIGGEIEMLRYLKTNTKYPEIEKKLGNQGTVWVSFVVGKDGKIKNTKIERGVSKYLDAEALRVINAMPDWIPGKQ
ncbi:MAG: energy transducer TonB, partial [Flavobacteriales bacterium CG_4_9_14_0_2_um_filter_32_27]